MKKKLPKAAVPFQFKPGQSGNPKGRPKNPIPDALKKLTNQSLRRVIRIVVKGNKDQIEKLINNPDTSMLELAVANSFVKAVAKGDYQTVEHILQRVLGKVPDRLIADFKSKNINVNSKPVKIDKEVMKEAWKELNEEV